MKCVKLVVVVAFMGSMSIAGDAEFVADQTPHLKPMPPKFSSRLKSIPEEGSVPEEEYTPHEISTFALTTVRNEAMDGDIVDGIASITKKNDGGGMRIDKFLRDIMAFKGGHKSKLVISINKALEHSPDVLNSHITQ